ncbi:hypothetical protein DFH09DRAFT_1337493 [Mycena vulgaris]|nr:hypothetical protein DFH09DRAFT_1337493 [Mycena vulgaris]
MTSPHVNDTSGRPWGHLPLGEWPLISRAIFEMAAIVYPEEIPTLMLVSQPVKSWLEPMQYQTISLTQYTKRQPTFEFLKLKRPGFLRDRVRHLCLDQFEFPRYMLEKCTEVIDLSLRPPELKAPKSTTPGCTTPEFESNASEFTTLEFTIPEPPTPESTTQKAQPFITPDFIALLGKMSLQRLSTIVRDLLGDFKKHHLDHTAFANITHLAMFDAVKSCTWEEWHELEDLPSLTHLCLGDEISLSLLRGVLRNCKTLRVFINLWRDFKEIQPEEYCESVGMSDARFVMLETGDWVYEWEIGVRGGQDMWDRAQKFIADKERGAIHKSEFWLYGGLWEAELDPDPPSESEYDSDNTIAVSNDDSESNDDVDSESNDGIVDEDAVCFTSDDLGALLPHCSLSALDPVKIRLKQIMPRPA